MHLTLNGVPLDVDVTTLADLVGPLPAGQAAAVNLEVRAARATTAASCSPTATWSRS